MIIRKAGPGDFDVMARVWLAASRVGHPFLGEAVLASQFDKVRGLYLPMAENWVAEDEAVIGFIGMLGSHIGGLFVEPEQHRRGAGRRLVDHAGNVFGGLTVDVYEQNQAALGFYVSCGFVVAGRRDRDDEGRPLALLELVRAG